MNIMTPNILKAVFGIACITASTATAKESYSPYADKDYPQNVYWGDTHLHTSYSVDSYIFGTRLTPDIAYRFAKGEAIKDQNGVIRKLHKPLDFLVIAEHAENLNYLGRLMADDPLLMDNESAKYWKGVFEKDTAVIDAKPSPKKWDQIEILLKELIYSHVDLTGDTFKKSVWHDITSRADRFNIPGKFSAFSGFEWTPPFRINDGYHRVVIFSDSMDKVSQTLPFSHADSDDPEDLWQYLADYNRKTGGDVLAIPHNSNLSGYNNNPTFATWDLRGKPLSKEYAIMRQRWEPLVEVSQNKGDSETHPLLSPNDAFADFETQDHNTPSPEMLQYQYARSALKIGLNQQAMLGVNPFKFGMIGSTDSHIALSTVENDNFAGNLSFSLNYEQDFATGAYAAIWAEENTRKALFAAMKRKETYSSTGSRMMVRFFGGWNYEKEDALRPNLAQIGYSKGVPMGGDLTRAPNGKALKFLIRAVKDPHGANLDRVQVIKGWRAKDGKLHEKIYNVALSDGRIDQGPKTKKVGSTIDIEDASYTNSIGAPELATVWTDPDFDPNELAFYYARVLEIPTPRWPVYYAKETGDKNLSDKYPLTTQERAYTSPIWYNPAPAQVK